jgi:hypothetical protein
VTRILNYVMGIGLSVLVAAIVIPALLPRFSLNIPWPDDPYSIAAITWLGAPLYLVLITPLILFAGWWWGPRRKIGALVAITILLFFVIFAYSTQMLENRFTLILLYLIAIATAGLALETFSGASWRQSITPIALVGVIFALLGFSHIWTWEQFKEKIAWRSSSQQTAFAPAEDSLRGTSLRLGVKTLVMFGPTPLRINPNGQYAPDIWHEDGCLYLQRAAWTGDNKIYGPLCSGRLPNDVEWAWSSGASFTGAVALQPPRYR